MNIQINTNYTTKCNYYPSFKTNNRVVKNLDSTVKWRNTTNFFRPDLQWNEMVDYFIKKYENVDKVRVLCYACSDGSEPISLAMLLIDKLGAKADKFFPIIAKDIDPTIIDKAKTGTIEIEHCDKDSMKYLLKNDVSNYLNIPPFLPTMYNVIASVKQNVKDSIHYSVADIRDEVHTIPKENTIVFARNFWPYLKAKNEVTDLACKLGNRLRGNSTLVVGNFDIFSGIQKALFLNGFKANELKLNNIYEPDRK